MNNNAFRDMMLMYIKLNSDYSCETCKWSSGKYTMSGLGSTYPCDSCRIDKWESKDKE
jgi:hypothetical protein